MFLNSPTLAERQYGYPAWSGFDPFGTEAAWRSFDGNPLDDVVALPSIATVGLAQLTQDLVFKNVRTLKGGSDPMGLQMLGANYWVIRAGSDAQSSNRDLAIRIVPTGMIKCTSTPGGGGRIVASAIAYNHVDTTATEDTNLWRHPEWATGVTSVQWTEVDSVSGEIEVVVPSFGVTNKVAVLVLTLAALVASDGVPLALQPGLGARLSFDLPTAPNGVNRDLFLHVRVRIAGAGSTSLTASGAQPGAAGNRSDIPRQFALGPAKPNPFVRQATITVELPIPSDLTLDVFDMLGRHVRELVHGPRPEGAYSVVWDARDDARSPVPPGVYLIRMRAGGLEFRKRVAVLP
jgi:hypothetical protein